METAKLARSAATSLLHIKTVIVDGQPVRLFSVDGGKLWFSKARDLKEFRQRRARAKAAIQALLAKHTSHDFPVVAPYSWMGFDR